MERIEEAEGIYEGAISEAEKEGQGCYLWYNGNFYFGAWERGHIEGIGTLFYANGGILRGHFSQGKLAGLGRGLYANGDTYVGTWRDGMFHGRGLFYVREKNQWQLGEFAAGSLTRLLDRGEGKPSFLSTRIR